VATQAEHFDVPPDQLLQLLQRLITLSREKRPPPLQQLTTLLGSGDYSLLAQPPASRPFSASVLLGHSTPFIHTTAVEATSYGAAPELNAMRNAAYACSPTSSFALIGGACSAHTSSARDGIATAGQASANASCLQALSSGTSHLIMGAHAPLHAQSNTPPLLFSCCS
jgi:hypothetical protein